LRPQNARAIILRRLNRRQAWESRRALIFMARLANSVIRALWTDRRTWWRRSAQDWAECWRVFAVEYFLQDEITAVRRRFSLLAHRSPQIHLFFKQLMCWNRNPTKPKRIKFAFLSLIIRLTIFILKRSRLVMVTIAVKHILSSSRICSVFARFSCAERTRVG